MKHRPDRPGPWQRAAVVTLGLALAGTGAVAAPALAQTVPAAPAAAAAPAPDVLDLDLTAGTPADAAQGLALTPHGAPVYGTDAGLGAGVVTFDGVDDALRVGFGDQWDKLGTGFTIECVFRFDGALPATAEKDVCSGKESGGAAVYVTGSQVGTMAHIGGGYKNARAEIQAGRWYHVLSVWDGDALKLYVNGVLASQVSATGALGLPSASARDFLLGADGGPSNAVQFPAAATVAQAGVFSRAVTDDEATALAGAWATRPQAPTADVLDVDFATGTADDQAQGLAVTTHGAPRLVDDTAVGRKVAVFDGSDDAYSYAFGDQWSRLTDGFSVECVFKYDGTLPTATKNPCSSKESGGFAFEIQSNGNISFMAHVAGGYKYAGVPLTPGRWYHLVGVWDGAKVGLYVDGRLAAETPAAGTLGLPSGDARNHYYVGADSVNQFWTDGTVASSRVFSGVLDAAEISALNAASLGEYRNAPVSLVSSTPAAGVHLTAATRFQATIDVPSNASGWQYTLDGAAITPGQVIGAGMRAGDHLIVLTATTVFGEPVRIEIPFTSGDIPVSGGTDVGQGSGVVTLSAVAHDPAGNDVTTTFTQNEVSIADGGVQGVVTALPTTLDFEYTEGGQIAGAQRPDGERAQSVASGQIPFQRFDVAVPAAAGGQQIVWSGVVDPERSVHLHAWDAAEQRWAELASARGLQDGDTTLTGEVTASMVDGGVVHVLVVGEDPFADDLSPRDASAQDDKDGFASPEDYDFSFAHFTDTQYLSEGAAGGTYDDFDGVAETSDVMAAEEQAVWAQSYRASTQWIADNAAERKIAYTAHTGDVIENDISDPTTKPGLAAQVDRELAFADTAQRTLDENGVVNQVIAGNHDNQSGNETGPTSRFSTTFGAGRYYDAAASWPAGASYHAWDETTDEAGNTVERGADNQNNYLLFSAGGLDFVAVGVSYGVTVEEADWASDIFARYPDRNGILLTHAYLAPSANPDGRGASFSTDGSRAFDRIVEDNPNVFLVLAGHEHGVGTNLKPNVGAVVEHDVVELLADYQFYTVPASELFPGLADAAGNIDVNGDGKVDHKSTDRLQFGASFLRLLQFDVESSTVSIDTYSPFLDNFGATEYDTDNRYNGAEDNLVLPVDLSSRTTSFATDALVVVTPTGDVIGEATARSGWPASVTWAGLTEGELYAWSATSRNAEGDTLGTVDQFGGLFVATAAGTDVTAPVLTVPGAVSIAQGEAFDPLAGVSAVDDTDGDVTANVRVVGGVDTTTPGTYALTYLVADTNGNQAITSRAVTVTPVVDDRATTTVTVKDVTVKDGATVRLSAKIAPATATGAVRFLVGEDVWCEGELSHGKAECVVAQSLAPDSYVLTAQYLGDTEHLPVEDTFVVTVKPGKGRH